ncbi:uncharacterized protein AKAME5_002035000 [Lates japonicus]|uniref:Uncharacterized protein n=1 Tax=Lates japonicus TaxID=270547 RepID=A0AAD3NBY4_LATJO|nr:uncharacterized protein AKAME5_002035000 [Lates japonicus]
MMSRKIDQSRDIIPEKLQSWFDRELSEAAERLVEDYRKIDTHRHAIQRCRPQVSGTLDPEKNLLLHESLEGKKKNDCHTRIAEQVRVFSDVTGQTFGAHVTILEKEAMSRIQGNKSVILVLMHHTRNPDHVTKGTRWSENYQQVVLVVHVLFHETKQGLLECEKNENAVQHIQEMLMRYTRPQESGHVDEHKTEGSSRPKCCSIL